MGQKNRNNIWMVFWGHSESNLDRTFRGTVASGNRFFETTNNRFFYEDHLIVPTTTRYLFKNPVYEQRSPLLHPPRVLYAMTFYVSPLSCSASPPSLQVSLAHLCSRCEHQWPLSLLSAVLYLFLSLLCNSSEWYFISISSHGWCIKLFISSYLLFRCLSWVCCINMVAFCSILYPWPNGMSFLSCNPYLMNQLKC